METKFLFTTGTYFLSAVIFSTESLCCLYLHPVLPRNNLSATHTHTHTPFLLQKANEMKQIMTWHEVCLDKIVGYVLFVIEFVSFRCCRETKLIIFKNKCLNLCKTFGNKCLMKKRLKVSSPLYRHSGDAVRNGLQTQLYCREQAVRKYDNMKISHLKPKFAMYFVCCLILRCSVTLLHIQILY